MGASEYLVSAGVGPGCGWQKEPRTTELYELDAHLSPNAKVKQLRASRRSVSSLLETMLTNAEMNRRPATRQSYTPAHDAFVARAGTQQLQLGAGHTTLDQVLVRYLDKEVFAKGESAAVSQMVLPRCNLLPRGPCATPHIMLPSSSNGLHETNQVTPRTHCRWKRF